MNNAISSGNDVRCLIGCSGFDEYGNEEIHELIGYTVLMHREMSK